MSTKKIVVPIVGLAAVAALGAGAWVLEAHAADSLSDTVRTEVQGLLPGGTVRTAEVTDSPALLAATRDTVQQTVVEGSTAQDDDVRMFVREYDRDAERADSVSWQLEGLALAPGWDPVPDDDGIFVNEARTTVEGHDVTITAAAGLAGDTLTLRVDEVTVDGAATTVADAPDAVRAALAELEPLTVPAPLPGAAGEIRSVWFDDRGLGVDLYARDVTSALR